MNLAEQGLFLPITGQEQAPSFWAAAGACPEAASGTEGKRMVNGGAAAKQAIIAKKLYNYILLY